MSTGTTRARKGHWTSRCVETGEMSCMSMIKDSSRVMSNGVRVWTETTKLGHVLNWFKAHPTIPSFVAGGLALGGVASVIPGNPMEFGSPGSATLLGTTALLVGAGIVGKGLQGDVNTAMVKAGMGVAAAGTGYAVLSNWA